MTVDDLPTLRVTSIADQSALCTWDSERWIGNRHIACILVDKSQFVWGRLADIDTASQECRFTPDSASELNTFVVGSSYPYLDGYWGKRAELVLDRTKQWQERRFNPPDAVWFEESRTMTPLRGKTPPGGELVPGAWDHEHCKICDETISLETDPIGFFAEPHHWICRECYKHFVRPRSIDFIVDNQ